ncbi:hypothetical protein CPB84DRAFT_1859373 [Gymnopilus junonius]|uniref:Uncharacterized protein n=1 Tax=Gymnopilus junonius TaxID=109634 RepID=A0A9P5N7Y7_GYMJU|nr:hypothetical protein CPB84DRAFT_1859373 [Gymnopilus junonius]
MVMKKKSFDTFSDIIIAQPLRYIRRAIQIICKANILPDIIINIKPEKAVELNLWWNLDTFGCMLTMDEILHIQAELVILASKVLDSRLFSLELLASMGFKLEAVDSFPIGLFKTFKFKFMLPKMFTDPLLYSQGIHTSMQEVVAQLTFLNWLAHQQKAWLSCP